MSFDFSYSYREALPGAGIAHSPDQAPDPALFALNAPLARELGLDPDLLQREGASWFSGARLPEGAEPLALAYAGHQFGGFSPSLGDGRAHLLGEFHAADGRLFDLQLKGSGRTPFSRGGDGKAVLGPMLREYLISESMAALGLPTTRSLAVVTTGEAVLRERGPLPGAVLARVAASHIRVGTFQYFAARGEGAKVRALADYAIARHYPELSAQPEPYLAFFDAVTARQARLIAGWMGIGFIHGVMNTDNMAISGETIDYGPCAFMEEFSPGTVFSSIDRQGRYSWANQPHILTWNLARLAETLLPLIDEDQARAVEVLNGRLQNVASLYEAEWLAVMRGKLGLHGTDPQDAALISDLLIALSGADWTLFFRRLADLAGGRPSGLMALFGEAGDRAAITAWLGRWRARAGIGAQETDPGADPGAGAALAQRMNAVNPAVIARNHRVEEALSAAMEGDRKPFHDLLEALRHPFRESEAYMLPAPAAFGRYVTFCGT